MFDYHLHSYVSFDSECAPEDMVKAAENNGLKEICFCDHYDFNDVFREKHNLFSIEDYAKSYDNLFSDSVIIRRGVEFGLTPWNKNEFENLLKLYNFDFVLGSVHFIGGFDPYYKDFWNNYSSTQEAFEKVLIHTLECIKEHNNFDVLAHLNYVCRYADDNKGKLFSYNDFTDIIDEIFKTLVSKGKGLEINTSGYDRLNTFLPSFEFVKRFKELGGEIITVGSDAHNNDRVGQHIDGALEIAKDIFGYVCTFDKRKVILNKL